ncbi:MAG: hypothetical protein ABIA37_01650, partial [Candidatus Woesearchaeota archaeon]
EKLKKAFPTKKRLHGSRDYFQINYLGYDFEVVPILNVTNSKQAVNITDVSPLHAKWVNANAKKVKDEIRLAKAFAKANSCYGAESYINGFSGYVLEIIVTYYGSFIDLLRAAVRWEHKDIIDTEKYYPSRENLFMEINQSKLHSALIVIDPVDKTRNAAAALDMEKFFLFKEKAAAFLETPGLDLFEKEKTSFQKLEKQTLHNLVYVEVTPTSGKDDVVGTKLLKAFQQLREKLKPFEISSSGWEWDKGNKATFYYILEKRQIDPFVIRTGPPLKMEEQVKAFKKKNKDTYQEKNRLMAKVPLKEYHLQDAVAVALKEEYIKKKIKAVKKIQVG